MTGGNLTYSHRAILINNLSNKDFGVFTNSITSQKELLFKSNGLSLPFKDAAGTTVGSVRKVTGKSAVKKVALALLNTACPCADCNYEYGYSLERRVKKPGVLNSEMYPHAVYYGGSLKNISCTAGVIDSTALEAMRTDIIDQVSNHVAYSQNGFDAVAEAAIARIITFDDAKTVIINGVTIVVATLTITEAIAAINAAPTTLVKAYRLPSSIHASKIVLVGLNGATEMTLTGTSVADANIYIGHTSKGEDEVTFAIKDTNRSISTINIVEGSWAVLTPDDVYREFSQMAHDGSLANQHRVEKPMNVPYSKYIFTLLQGVNAIHGASHGDTYTTQIHVYIPSSLVSTDLWDASDLMWESVADDATFVADTTFEELIGLSGATGWKS